MAKRSKKVAFYLRVPTRHQDTPAGSLTSQKQRLFEWFKYHNSQAKFADIMDCFFLMWVLWNGQMRARWMTMELQQQLYLQKM